MGRREDAHSLAARGDEAQCYRVFRTKTAKERKLRKTGEKRMEQEGAGEAHEQTGSP